MTSRICLCVYMHSYAFDYFHLLFLFSLHIILSLYHITTIFFKDHFMNVYLHRKNSVKDAQPDQAEDSVHHDSVDPVRTIPLLPVWDFNPMRH